MKKEIVTQVSIKSSNPNWNPVFNSLKVGPDDEGGGSYLRSLEKIFMEGAVVRVLD